MSLSRIEHDDHPYVGLIPGEHTRHHYQSKHRPHSTEASLQPFSGPCPVIIGDPSFQNSVEDNDWDFISVAESSSNGCLSIATPSCVSKNSLPVGYDPGKAIVMSINGKSVTVIPDSPHQSLAEYLRYDMHLTGTKIGCGEGGCGACTVLLSKTSNNTTSHMLANSCMRPLCACDGLSVVTTEGLGSSATGFHPIHKAISENDATQCGYCSSGFSVSMAGLISQATPLTEDAIENHFSGNLCRCTGYRPILKAMRTLIPQRKDGCTGTCKTCPNHNTDIEDLHTKLAHLTIPPSDMIKDDHSNYSAVVGDDGSLWFDPKSLSESLTLLNLYYMQYAVRLCVGNTSSGVVKYLSPSMDDTPSVFINVASVPELLTSVASTTSLTVGASVTLSNLIIAIDALPVTAGLTPISSHLKLVAHPQVRDVGSWAGNIMIAKRHPEFPSDLMVVLSAAGASVSIITSAETTTMTLTSFADPAFSMPRNSMLTSLTIPFVPAATTDASAFDSYKIMSRHINTHAEVNAGFYLELAAPSSPSTLWTITAARLCVGNICFPSPFLCPDTTSSLIGKTIEPATLSAVLPKLALECVPSPCPVLDPNFVVADADYRQKLAVSLFYRFFMGVILKKGPPNSVGPRVLSGLGHYQRPISTGSQTFGAPPSGEAPAGLPIHKLEGALQASGETKYTADLPMPSNTVFAVPLLATKVGVTVLSVDVSKTLASPGVVAFVSAADIKRMWKLNTLTGTGYNIFSSGNVNAVGEIIGLVLALSFEKARAGRKLAVVSYSSSESSSYKNMSKAVSNGDIAHGVTRMASTIQAADNGNVNDHDIITATGSLTTTGQKHFYMETQVTLAIPQANDEITVYCATQAIAVLQKELSLAMLKLTSKVHVCASQIGGAYGGKAFFPAPIAAAACMAALSVNRPVLLQLDRQDDMTCLGGRPPLSANWSVSLDHTSGRVTGLEITANVDNGYGKDMMMNCTSLNAYVIPSAKLKSISVFTNHPKNSIMRAPGEFQGALLTEAAIECVAKAAGVKFSDIHLIQAATMDPACQPVWKACLDNATNLKLAADCENYNNSNRWRKRGMYMMPVLYSMDNRQYGEKAFVTINHDGSILLSHSGLEVGQGINTKAAQACAMALSSIAPVDISLITTALIKSTDQFNNCTPTWGSGTSESVCDAVLNACGKISTELSKNIVSNDWKATVAKALGSSTSLTKSGSHYIAVDGGAYGIYTAGSCVVEIDVLTGVYEILRADLFYDCGTSLNPAIDIGQIEGSFVQASGAVLCERQTRSDKDGRLVSNGTWDYKIPSSLDIPHSINITLIPSSNVAKGNVLGSKASGEPAYLLGVLPYFAIKGAIYAAREEISRTDYFVLDVPATPERVQKACLLSWP